MEVSPGKSLEVVSDSEEEQDHPPTSDLLNQLQHDPNVGILPVSRDQLPCYTTPTMSSYNPSSHISQFPTIPPASTIDSSIQSGSELPATTPRSRPRPRMRPPPPPDGPDTSIGAFSTMPPDFAPPTDTVSSFGNSAVQDVPIARPPSLPPSSLPTVDSSSSMIQPTFPIAPAVQENPKSKPMSTAAKVISANSSNAIIPPTMSSEPSAPTNPKRIKPKMRPPPPPEPSTMTPGTSTTAPSVAATDSSSNLPTNPSTSATSHSAGSKASSAQQRSALEDAQEYTGRGARRLKQLSKPKQDDYVDVGGPEDDIIMLLSSDTEQSAKPKPKPKKKPSTKVTNKSTPPDPTLDEQSPASSSRVPPILLNRSKRKSPQPHTSDDEFGRWDTPIPGETSNPTRATSTKKRKKAAIEYSDDETVKPPALPPIVPLEPSRIPVPSSPLSSPGRSPVTKRKEPSSAIDDPIPTTVKKPRKSAGTMEIVLPTLGESSKKKSKAKGKAKSKSAAQNTPTEPNAQEQAYVPPALDEAATAPSGSSMPQLGKTPTPPQPVDEGEAATKAAIDADTALKEAEPPITGKKPTKKKAAKGKKGAAAAPEGEVAGGNVEAPKKPARGKGKAKAKEAEAAASSNASGTPPVIPNPTSSNPDAAAAATSSNPSAGEAGSSNPPAPNQTPAPKPSRPKPRHSTTPASMPVAMGASGALIQSTGRKSTERPLSETLRLALGGTGSPAPRMGLSRRGSSKIAPLLAIRGVPPPPPPPMPKKPLRKKKGQDDDEDSEEGSEWEKLTDKQREKKRKEKEMAAWYSD